jgi:hypothetical protein
VLLLVKTPLQPPDAVAVANHAAKLVLIAACVWQAAAVVLIGQVSTTVGGAVTVKLELHEPVLLQSSVTL